MSQTIPAEFDGANALSQSKHFEKTALVTSMVELAAPPRAI
jgi:hypothetical protein